ACVLEYQSVLSKRVGELKRAMSLMERASKKIKTLYLFAIRSLLNLIEMRSPPLAAHGQRVAGLARCLAEIQGLSELEVKHIYHAALLHDIGKIGVSDQILKTPISELDGDARVDLSQHSASGYRAVKKLLGDTDVAQFIRHHHERYDGKGFPDGLVGTAIPLGARIIAIAEDFDELMQGWVAPKKLTEAAALEFIAKAATTRYDPTLVALLPKALEELKGMPGKHEKIVNANTLRPGMVITRDLKDAAGRLLIAANGTATEGVIGRLTEQERQKARPAAIYVHKYKTAPVKGKPLQTN
ncbi:MAG: HD domain-containing protein, partial [Limnobacter sp.]|nr:HD domain-containing protein [Limnobacter sp.]